MIIYDSSSETVFGPCDLKLDAKPDKCLLIFDDEIWDDYVLTNKNLATFSVKNTYGRIFDTYRYLDMNGEKILLVYPTTGSAGSVCDIELLIASGIKKFVAFGTCGRLDKKYCKKYDYSSHRCISRRRDQLSLSARFRWNWGGPNTSAEGKISFW